MFLSISPFRSVNICFIRLDTSILAAKIFKTVKLFLDWPLHIFIFFVSFYSLCLFTFAFTFTEIFDRGAWVTLWSARIQLRSWSPGSWVQAPHWALCCQCGACFRSCFFLSLPLPHSCICSLSKINKHLKKFLRHYWEIWNYHHFVNFFLAVL